MTASSPCTDGMIETRKSIERPPSFTRKRPSCGTRFSAMSSSDMTLIRLMIVEWCSLPMVHGRLQHAVDAVLDHHLGVAGLDVDVGGAPAERVEDRRVDEPDDRRLVGLDLVDRQDLVAVLVVAQELDLEGLRGLLEHALRALAALQGLLDRRGRPHGRLDRRLQDEAQLVHHRDVGGVGHHEDELLPLPPVGQEVVAEHQLDRHGLQDLGVGRERRDVHVLEAVAGGQGPGGVLLGRRGERPRRVVRDADRARVGPRRSPRVPARPRWPGTSAGRRPAACAATITAISTRSTGSTSDSTVAILVSSSSS